MVAMGEVVGPGAGCGVRMMRFMADQKLSTRKETVDSEKRLSLNEFAAMVMQSLIERHSEPVDFRHHDNSIA